MINPQLIDEEALKGYDDISFVHLSVEDQTHISNLIFSLKTAYDQMNMDSSNSSLSPSSDLFKKQKKDEPSSEENPDSSGEKEKQKHHNKADQRAKRKNGFGRTQKLPVDAVEDKKPKCCSKCSDDFTEDHKSIAFGGYYQLDMSTGKSGYKVINTKYITYKTYCEKCDLWTLYKAPEHITSEGFIINDRGLIGCTFSGVIATLNKRYLLSVKKIKQMIYDFWKIELSEGAINRTILEAALCCEPPVEQIIEDLINSDLCHADETTWHEQNKKKWLWVFISATACLYMVGGRNKEMAETIINDRFNGWLMSDGYVSYRFYKRRLRCLAHLKRKAKWLSESRHKEAVNFGIKTLRLLKLIFDAVYDARLNGSGSIKLKFIQKLAEFKMFCISHFNSAIAKVRALAVEFLNDWIAIFRILEYPQLPLTNNEAERALRHWVIARRLSLGSQSKLGSKALGLLASMIETAKLRGRDVITTLADTIKGFKTGDKALNLTLTNVKLEIAA